MYFSRLAHSFFISQGTIIAVAAFLFLISYSFMLHVKDMTYSRREKIGNIMVKTHDNFPSLIL